MNNIHEYARGFIASTSGIHYSCEEWRQESILDLNITYDTRCDFAKALIDDYYFAMIGTALDIETGCFGCSKVLHEIVSAHQLGENSFLEKLDTINGRFVLFYGRKQGVSQSRFLRIFNDATGMRSVFYSDSGDLYLSSHPRLLALQINAQKNSNNKFLTKYSGYSLPGNVTTFNNIKQLIPNHFLDCESRSLLRFWPREALKPTGDLDSTVTELAENLNRQVSHLARHGVKILCSLSAGIDSRVTLAATKSASRNIKYFTYYGREDGFAREVLSIDHAVACEIADSLGLNHELIDLSNLLADESLQNIQKKIGSPSHIVHGKALAAAYVKFFGNGNFIHLRSNLLEIGRNFFKKAYTTLPKIINSTSAAFCYSTKAVGDAEVEELFAEFLDIVRYDQINGYDPYDLFYWEYRMAMWHSLILLESDSAFETFILFNNRRFLTLLLSIPSGKRQGFELMLDLCKKNWPVVTFWGVNEISNLLEKNKIQSTNEIGSVNLIEATIFSESENANRAPPIDVVHNKAGVRVAFIETAPLLGDRIRVQFSIKRKNVSHGYLTINLRTPYANPILIGRLCYKIYINSILYCSSDVSSWPDLNQVIIPLPAPLSNTIDNHDIACEVLLDTTKNCESWNWGVASTLIIENIAIRNNINYIETKLKASNPFMNLFK